MQCYLIRHAHAVTAEEDIRRPLSARGRKQARVLSRFLRKVGDFDPKEIWTSPLARARGTANLLDLKAKLITVPELETSAGVATLARKLQTSRQSVALVGHEPHLSALVSLLLAGSEEPPLVSLKKGATVALERTGKRWTLCWQIHPDLLAPRK